MSYTPDEIMQYIKEEDVKFIRLAFCDVFGKQKNISIMPDEVKRAFEYGIAIDASAVNGFGGEVHSDLLLHPANSSASFSNTTRTPSVSSAGPASSCRICSGSTSRSPMI